MKNEADIVPLITSSLLKSHLDIERSRESREYRQSNMYGIVGESALACIANFHLSYRK